MPDQFGNPLPGELSIPNVGGFAPNPAQLASFAAQAPAMPTQQQLAQEAAARGEELSPRQVAELQGTPPSAPVAPQAPVAPSAQPAQEPQFVSAPSAKPADVSALLAPVGEIGTGSSTTVSKTDLGAAGEKAAKAREEANAGTVQAISQQEAVDVERANARAAAAVDRAKVASAADAQIAQHTAQLQKDAAQGVIDIKRASDDYERAAGELGPDHFWQVQSTGQKIGNLLSIALSGIGQAFSAKAGIQARNGAMDLINAAIDRDIDMQKTSLMAKERGIRTKESLYSTLRQKGADDLSAMAATKASSLGRVDRELAAKEASADTKEAASRAAALRTQVQQAQAAELQRVAEATATRVQSTAGSRPVSGLEVAQMQAGAQAAQQDAERERLGLVKRDLALQTPVGQAPDKETARDLRDKVVAIEGAERSVKALRALVKGSANRLDPKKRKALNFARTELAQFIKSPAGANLGAALSEQEAELFLNEQLPDADWIQQLSGRTGVTLDLLDKKMKDTRESWKRAYTVRTQ